MNVKLQVSSGSGTPDDPFRYLAKNHEGIVIGDMLVPQDRADVEVHPATVGDAEIVEGELVLLSAQETPKRPNGETDGTEVRDV